MPRCTAAGRVAYLHGGPPARLLALLAQRSGPAWPAHGNGTELERECQCRRVCALPPRRRGRGLGTLRAGPPRPARRGETAVFQIPAPLRVRLDSSACSACCCSRRYALRCCDTARHGSPRPPATSLGGNPRFGEIGTPKLTLADDTPGHRDSAPPRRQRKLSSQPQAAGHTKGPRLYQAGAVDGVEGVRGVRPGSGRRSRRGDGMGCWSIDSIFGGRRGDTNSRRR